MSGKIRQIEVYYFCLHLAAISCWLLVFWFRDPVSRWFILDILKIPGEHGIAADVLFFLNTGLKLFLILVIVIFFLTIIRQLFPANLTRARLRKIPLLPATVLAGFFGAFTPFCSCSAVPVFISFLETGLPLGITFSFLVASPLVNEVIVIMLTGLFGWKIALVYAITGLTLAILAGWVVGLLNLERFLPIWLLNFRMERPVDVPPISFQQSWFSGLTGVKEILKRTWIYLIAGVLLGTLIHGYVPESILTFIAKPGAWYVIPLVVLLGVPFYACAAAIAPIAYALVDKGIPLSLTLAFTMAVAGLSLPEFVMLRRVLSFRLLMIFACILYVGIVLVAFLFQIIL